ncbi:hypothetical protein CONCODRAFT_2726 [Conidiobolus coronatus NRRL 28638]|uniref:RING-type domain-containing protein n=1 Tax=Conidiobolus coronatus (strain ATCC 28846 / CBS 209.66 / NRRL 28638) TaxID=796925 RepID=A0A137PGU2_CONC2|nr:hypothetical protein CONCODRAFT_2726 [Conidiobolus coronatus NRRL 28638]|eukprot:KXN74195.1 hypothetical protein CONCODRAFT_2726 [Conidiobolus coronatus NRRL 28638]
MNTAEFFSNFFSQSQPNNPENQSSRQMPQVFPIIFNFINGMPNNLNQNASAAHNTPPPQAGNGFHFHFAPNISGQAFFNFGGMTADQMGDDAYFDYMTRMAEQASMQDQKKMPPSASENARENLPIVNVTDIPADCKSCPICLDDFEASQELPIRQMPCQHVFHEACLFPWLKSTNSCPQCRFPLMTESNEYNEQVCNEVKSRYQNSPNQFHSTSPCELLPTGLCCGSTNDRMIKLSTCNHLFHSGCIKSSHLATGEMLDEFITHVKCPLCRKYSPVTSSLLTH